MMNTLNPNRLPGQLESTPQVPGVSSCENLPAGTCHNPAFNISWDGTPPPLLTADLPGIGGKIKIAPEDFEVEEIPAYEPSGAGDYLFLWMEKCDIGAEYFAREVARRLGLNACEVGTAGLKDRRAVTRQMVSVPARVRDRLEQLNGDGIRLLSVNRHGNKLKPGHLHGNRFRILIRDVHESAALRLPPLLDRLKTLGFPNYYGPQRFGRDGETLHAGLDLLNAGNERRRRGPSRFLRKLGLSAVQSALFNQYLARRLADGLLHRVLPGDVMTKVPFGGLFVAEEVKQEQERFDACAIVHTGPIYGRKLFAAKDQAGNREQAILEEAGLSPDAFTGFGKLMSGARRHNIVYVPDLSALVNDCGARIEVTLPAGAYATVLLREIMKSDDREVEMVGTSSSVFLEG